MKIADILELETITLVEPTFSDLIYPDMDGLMVTASGKAGKILVDQDENPVLFAQGDEEGQWAGCVTIFREPSYQLIERFELFEWEMYQEEADTILDAVRAYYSILLSNTTQPGPDDLNPSRVQSIQTLIERTVGIERGGVCLDCCCGTGVGSMVMEQQGMSVLAYDNDESLLVRGMKAGRLRPERTMWIDGRMISRFTKKKADLTCGFMIGEIHSFNRHIWHEIVTAACTVSDRVLFTTGTEAEIQAVQEWVCQAGKKAEVWESDADPIYDRWICYADD